MVAAKVHTFVAHGVVVFTKQPVTQESRQADSLNCYAQVLVEHALAPAVNPHKTPARF